MMTIHCKQTGLVMLLALLVVAGCERPDSEPVEMEPGQEPYLRYCASCHGNAGEGKPPAFPPIDGSEWLELPADGLALIVLNGLTGEIEVSGRTYRGFMPPMRNIGDEDIAAIIGFMEANWAGRESTLDAADVATLREKSAGQSPLNGREGVEDMLEQVR